MMGYTTFFHQAFRQKPRNNDCVTFAQPCPPDRFLPFQFRRPNHFSTTFDCKIYRASDDALIQDLTAFIPTGQKEIISIGAYDYITYYGSAPFNASEVMPCGIYYIKWTDGYITRYSEIFEVKSIETIGRYILATDDEYIWGDPTEYILTEDH